LALVAWPSHAAGNLQALSDCRLQSALPGMIDASLVLN
jgi:hypothetical protein